MRRLSLMLLMLLMLLSPSAARAEDRPKTVKSAGWTVTWTDQTAAAVGPKGEKVTVYAPPEEPTCEQDQHGRVLSVVGTVVSFHLSSGGSCEGAAHPYAYQSFNAVDVAAPTVKGAAVPVELARFFDQAEVDRAMKADTYLKELESKGDGDCELSLFSYKTQWAVYERKGKQVAVRLGLPHGCEVMRGRITQLGLRLTPKAPFAAAIEAADKDGLLMKKLAAGFEASE